LPILPIDTGRYGNAEMRRVFTEETRVQKQLDVEAALALAQAEVGDIPREDAEKIAAMASLKHVQLDRIKAIEAEIKHNWIDRNNKEQSSARKQNRIIEIKILNSKNNQL